MTPLDPRAVGATEGLSQPLHLFLNLAGRVEVGALTITVPDGRVYRVAGRSAGPVADITIRNSRMARRALLGGSVGFGESYMDGDWDTSDLPALLCLTAYNEDHLGDVHNAGAFLTLVRRLWHRFNDNTRRGSRRNIAHHYDLGNAFYERWLDGSMTYSSAVFEAGIHDLKSAQR